MAFDINAKLDLVVFSFVCNKCVNNIAPQNHPIRRLIGLHAYVNEILQYVNGVFFVSIFAFKPTFPFENGSMTYNTRFTIKHLSPSSAIHCNEFSLQMCDC